MNKENVIVKFNKFIYINVIANNSMINLILLAKVLFLLEDVMDHVKHIYQKIFIQKYNNKIVN